MIPEPVSSKPRKRCSAGLALPRPPSPISRASLACRRPMSTASFPPRTPSSKQSAGARIERLFLEIMKYHLENLIVEKRVHDIVLVAMENNWEAVQAHMERIG